MAEYSETVLNLAASCVSDHETLDKIADALANGTRRSRQQAAQVLAAVSHSDAAAVSGYSQIFVDSLSRPEAQTMSMPRFALTLSMGRRTRFSTRRAVRCILLRCDSSASSARFPSKILNVSGRLLMRAFNAGMVTLSSRIC